MEQREKINALNDAVRHAIGSRTAEGKTARDVYFYLQPGGELTTQVFPDAFEATAREVLTRFGYTPEVTHDQTHRKVRRISLKIPAEQLAASSPPQKPLAMEGSHISTQAMLEHLTGITWKKADDGGYDSDRLDIDAIREIKDTYFPDVKSGGEAVILQNNGIAYLELSPSYAMQWATGQFENPNAVVPGFKELRAQIAAAKAPSRAQARS